jgi:hypothetical protein
MDASEGGALLLYQGQIHIIGVQRRMADWSEDSARTWEDAVFGSQYMDARLHFPKTHGARGAAGRLP